MKSSVASEEVDARRVQVEDALKHLLDCDEAGRESTVDSLAGALGMDRPKALEVLGVLRARGLAEQPRDGHRLTAAGREYALRMARSHRLYETWLARETGVPPEHWHREAHKAEHRLAPEELDALANRLNNPRFDPHGDPIPTREGWLPQRPRVSMTAWTGGFPAQIDHIEDEPEELFRRLRRLGLAPGTRVEAMDHRPDGSVVCQIEGRQLEIPAPQASLIHLVECDPRATLPADAGRLSDLATGCEAVVHSLSPACTGAERRRLLDLGVVPGTHIRCEFASPFGSPRSYSIRGAMIALRDDQADRILILPCPAPKSK